MAKLQNKTKDDPKLVRTPKDGRISLYLKYYLGRTETPVVDDDGNRNQIILPLTSHTMCIKILRHWVARTGIEKHNTWHCARNSCGTNLLSKGANIKTAASILGHSGLAHTEKYTRAVDSLKQAAIDSMPPLDL